VYGGSVPAAGGTVQVIGTEDTYITDSTGKVYIRSRKAFNVSFNSEYGEGIASASVSASDKDTEDTFSIYPYVTVYGQMMAWNYMPLSRAVWVITNQNNSGWERRVTSDEWGYMETKMSNGLYRYHIEWEGIRYPINFEWEFRVYASDLNLGSTQLYFSSYEDHGKNNTPFTSPEAFKPAANGNVQFVICKYNASYCPCIKYRSSTPLRIDWGDGSPVEQIPVWNENETDSGELVHSYPPDDGIGGIRMRRYWQVEIMDCENLTFLSLVNAHFGAFWTIGNSALKNLSFKSMGFLAWIGDDVFKNDVGRTSADDVFYGTRMALPLGLFSTWKNVTSMVNTFRSMTFYPRPGYMQRLDFSHCLKLKSLCNTLSEMRLNRLPIINSRKLTDIRSICYNSTIEEIRSDDILPNEDGVAINSDTAFNYARGIKIFEFFNGVTKYNGSLMPNVIFENGAHMQIFETAPPIVGYLPTAKTLSDKDVWLYVPDESLEIYKGATGWKALSERMKPASEKPV
jgi:hypothetical protein